MFLQFLFLRVLVDKFYSFDLKVHQILVAWPWQAEFQEQLTKIHEQSRLKEEEVEGGWYTEERMEKDLCYSKCLVLKAEFAFCEGMSERQCLNTVWTFFSIYIGG